MSGSNRLRRFADLAPACVMARLAMEEALPPLWDMNLNDLLVG